MLVFGLVAGAGATLVAPKYLSWYASPPVPFGVSCDLAISWSMEKLVLFQSVGWVIGAVVGAVIAFKMKKSPVVPPPTVGPQP